MTTTSPTPVNTNAGQRHVYRTLLTLDGTQPDVRRAVIDVHYMHTLVMSAFLGRVPHDWNGVRESLGVLYAARPNRDSTLTVMVQSADLPTWRPANPALFTAPPEVFTYTPYYQPGQTLHFRLTGNPARHLPTPPGAAAARRPRRYITDVDGRREWLTRALDRAGATTVDAHETATGELRSEHKSRPPAQRRTPSDIFTIFTTTYTGTATVTNPAALDNAIRTGIGRGRAYGCGLLLTQPVG